MRLIDYSIDELARGEFQCSCGQKHYIGIDHIAIGKGALAGAVSALVYKLFIFICKNKQLPAVIIASVLTPTVNTGVFFLGMLVFFKDLLHQWTGSNTVFGMLTALIGLNFILELVLNVIISPVITAQLTKNGKIKRIK